MWPSDLNIDVSREMYEKLEIYHALLLKWQRAINLVSPKTIDEAWCRHFADSAQIERYISHIPGDVSRESRMVFDLGSGAGFPGMVLAIMRSDLKVRLIESDERKCQFLKTVSRETGVDVTVHNTRIECAQGDVCPDFVTARALADLKTLLGYVAPWASSSPHLQCLFLKGVQAGEELDAARAHFLFDCEAYQSVTDSQACVLHLRNIASKSGV
ncbi:MAG: 16S rRNA (guanine(527)-N(7))-methyltransferase RsmG [Alphaproteobacteria bacterium]